MTAKPKTIRLYPVPGVSLYPYPALEFDADEATAAALLAHIPPPFTTEPPSPPETAPEAGED